jgi:hypothetical protein
MLGYFLLGQDRSGYDSLFQVVMISKIISAKARLMYLSHVNSHQDRLDQDVRVSQVRSR